MVRVINMSNFEYDLRVESEISRFLDLYLYERKLNTGSITGYKRCSDSDSQHKGIDVIIYKNSFDKSQEFTIDEKTAFTYYRNDLSKPSLPTFSFEVAYEKDGREIEGWLYSDKYRDTDLYLLNWIWTDETIGDYKKIKFENIIKLEYILLTKKSLHDYLQSDFRINKKTIRNEAMLAKEVMKLFGINKLRLDYKSFLNRVPEILDGKLNVTFDDVINPDNEILKELFCDKHTPYWFHSIQSSNNLIKKLDEKPLNIIIKKKKLLAKTIASSDVIEI